MASPVASFRQTEYRTNIKKRVKMHFTYGININMAYQNFDLSAFFYGVQGADLFHYTRLYNSFPLFFNGNRTTDVLDSWTPSNPDASMPALSEAIRNNEATASNSFFVEDGSYIRLKNPTPRGKRPGYVSGQVFSATDPGLRGNYDF